mmetsp:Transcript_6291/g.15589  ORF Transcript_6291/g.15589 Transcript_6291/m.15589 type:complete len:335 (-) Transcript_6291:58-1062(-)|eukprot:CAMPEP_0197177982 /NCGR_PEP_ID=MMETSP1423-20130617/3398_1 /TAXON_ID=476441 /ORGANISM="Pseudo-nitzschia heimii, Strain UNC1101" /LENGTH=334 /DNA_ID=CAMNT_0042627619 /DNA_START=142 /DNA_END=1146 /DNA_ORIENTATION=-
MSILGKHAEVPPLVYRSSYVRLLLVIFFVVASEAFSTFSFRQMRRIIYHADLDRKQDIKRHANRLHKLTMAAQIPTSNVTSDHTTFADNVIWNKSDLDDVKYIDHDLSDKLEDLSAMDTMEIKGRLLDLLPQMIGTPQEYNLVELYVNKLEESYAPVQTLDFLNMAMAGEWQLLFSSNIGSSSGYDFRLRELYQRIDPNGFNGTIVNEATWDLTEDHEDTTEGHGDSITPTLFNAHGSFSIECSYSINQSARMLLQLNDHVIKLGNGSDVPKDIQRLVSFLYRAIPTELFDPNEHAMGTTFLDADLRIVRITGPAFEAVRNIFIRRGSMQIDPT